MPNRTAPALLGLALLARAASAQSAPGLAAHFGFEEPRFIVVDKGVGPAIIADFDADGLLDLACANNSKSRIELHIQRSTPRTDQEVQRDLKPNELPPSRFYDRVEISVGHRVTAFLAHDFDADGRLDLLYAGQPAELVVLKQTDRLSFDILSKRRVTGLAAGSVGLEIADVSGDDTPELLAIVAGKIHVFSLSNSGPIGEPTELGSGDSSAAIVAIFTEDYNGDGLTDILGVIPEDPAPLRLWLQDPVAHLHAGAGKRGQIGPETRFESPALREAEAVRFPGRPAASIGVIERASRRTVYYDLLSASIDATDDAGAERDAASEVYSFPGVAGKGRSLAVADLDADGLLDLIATDQKANSLLLYPQDAAVGLSRIERFSTFKDPKAVALGQWNDDAPLEVFILSEADKAVGVSLFDPEAHRLSFPTPLPIATEGASPVAMTYARFASGPALAVVVKDRRDHALEIHRPGGAAPAVVKLTDVNRPPQSLLAGDFDHDGAADLLLFTPGEPLVMVRGIDGPAESAQVLTDKKMPQFGLVQAAASDNTALLDIDADGHDELLIADQNFVRACSFDATRGWRVVEQITVPDATASLVSLTILPANAADAAGGPAIVAYDKSGKRLVLMRRDADGKWGVADRLRFSSFPVASLAAGALSADGRPDILCAADDAFAIVRLAGARLSLDEFAAFRSDDDDRLEHEIEIGDLNSDGYTDAVVLDARSQMCQVFTFSANRRLSLATEFKVFESRLFNRGDEREFQPSAAFIADLTGDRASDLILQAHDRYIVYPQMRRP